jgi:hypothetical protein
VLTFSFGPGVALSGMTKLHVHASGARLSKRNVVTNMVLIYLGVKSFSYVQLISRQDRFDAKIVL